MKSLTKIPWRRTMMKTTRFSRANHASATTVVTLSGSKIWKTRSPLHSHAAQKPKMTGSVSLALTYRGNTQKIKK
ncbi:hypothetical protein EJB05_26657, partial [Eragrostis curvula]